MKSITFKHLAILRQAITDNLEHVPEVTLVYLFGSQVEGDVGPLSDYDFAVLVGKPELGPYVRSRLAFELSRRIEATKIDIVLLNHAPIELAFAVISRGKLLYQRGDAERIEYEARIMGLYFDYLPVLRSQRDDILRGGEYEARIHRYREAFGRTARTLIKIRTSQE
jgi:predicted nucleotidyltransferase